MKRIGKILLCLLFVLGLSGCVKYNITMKVDEDGKVAAEMELLAQESFLQQANTTAEDWMKEAKEEIEEKYKDKTGTKIDFKETSKTINDQKYVGGIFTITDTAQDQAVKKEEKDGKDVLTLTLPLSDVVGEEMDSEELEGFDVSQMKSMGIEMNLIIEMPANAKSTVGEVKDNVVTIDLLDVIYNKKATDIVVTCEIDKGVDMTMVIAGVAGVVVIAGACWFIFKKKKPAKEDVINE